MLNMRSSSVYSLKKRNILMCGFNYFIPHILPEITFVVNNFRNIKYNISLDYGMLFPYPLNSQLLFFLRLFFSAACRMS